MNWRCSANKGLIMLDSLNRKQLKKKRKQSNKTKNKKIKQKKKTTKWNKTNSWNPQKYKQKHLIDHLILLCDSTNKVKFHVKYLYCQNENVILFHLTSLYIHNLHVIYIIIFDISISKLCIYNHIFIQCTWIRNNLISADNLYIFHESSKFKV